MKNNFTIFYSWQSDIKKNKNVIQTCIEKAIRDVKKNFNKEINLKINIDRDTRNTSGSPSISSTIFQKIDVSDIFICDITLVNKNWYNQIFKYRLSPNPNVLVELGYAVNRIGWERVICINDLDFSTIEELPFDIKGHRITCFNSSENNFKENLKSQLVIAIKAIIENYDGIVKNQNIKNNKYHDLNLYNKFTELCNESILLDSISLSVNSLFINKYYLEKWDALQEFYKISENVFIDTLLDESVIKFLKDLDKFHSLISKDFHLDNENTQYQEYLSLKMSDIVLTDEQEYNYKQTQIYKPNKEPYRSESWKDSDKRIIDLQDKLFEQGEIVKSSYRDFVMIVKKNLL